MTTGDKATPRKVMVVAEPTRESAGALQYALYNAILEKDELILLHVENPNTWFNTLSAMFLINKRPPIGGSAATEGGGGGAVVGGGEVDFLEEMKSMCKVTQPKLLVRTVRVLMENGKDKAAVILSQTKELKIDLIIIGQRRTLSSAILGYKRPAGPPNIIGTKLIDTAEFLIENSPCTCVGVQKKQNAGYVLNTKTHRNFRLLA
ncbi:hypothetical protein L6164_028751 [Bauhinia variegata]|uniref:Uncharacterized protein n=1 Tax=Bauhinia variegata TaxID=167791 RepID=A0ACB9L6N6_BAUVA|nr:hypothetical protein L6164_028751 [Bauhinia variegata]